MATEVRITLPPNTMIGVTGFANSTLTQQILVEIDGAPVVTLSGAGRTNTLLGSRTFNSGSGRCTVHISAGGRLSQLTSAHLILEDRLHVVAIGSEDGTDMDFNDGICIMNWPLG